MANGKRSQANKIDMETRRKRAIELRKRGFSLRAIADALGVTAPTIQKDLQFMLQQLRSDNLQEAALLREMELERLDDLWKAIHKNIDAGHLGAIDRALKIMERRAKLLGLDAAEKTEVSGPAGRPQEQRIAIDLHSMSDDELRRFIQHLKN